MDPFTHTFVGLAAAKAGLHPTINIVCYGLRYEPNDEEREIGRFGDAVSKNRRRICFYGELS